MNILLLGGTGFIGPHLTDVALSRGHTVTHFNRGNRSRSDVEAIVGDRGKDLDALRGRTWDAVIDVAAMLPTWVRASCDVLKGNVGRYCFISTISVYPADSFAEIGKDESAAVDVLPSNADEGVFKMELYGALKARCEAVVRGTFGDKATIVRPGLIVGPGDNSDRFTYWPDRIARGGEVLAPGSPEAFTQFIDTRDLAEWTISLLENDTAGTFNATGEPMTMQTCLDSIRNAIGSDAKLTWVPDDFCLKHELGPWMEMPLWIPQEPDSIGFAQTSIARAKAAGLTFRPLAETARDTLAWSQTLPLDRKKRAGLTPDKEAKILAAWHASMSS